MKLLFNKKVYSFIIISLLTPALIIAQNRAVVAEKSDGVIINFRCNEYSIDSLYSNNKMNLDKIDSFLKDTSSTALLDSIIIRACASPEGAQVYNEWLANQRAIAVKQYLISHYPLIQKLPLATISSGENWTGLIELMEKDDMCPDRLKILEILKEDISPIERERRIKTLANGDSWQYIKIHMLKNLRGASCLVFKLKYSESTMNQINPAFLNLIKHDSCELKPKVDTDYLPEIRGFKENNTTIRPLALKTNMLFDALSLLNVEVEVPIHKRFSIAGEWIFPWWLSNDKQNCIQVLSGNLEFRYWFKPLFRKQDKRLLKHNPLTGYFIGLYSGGGLYDIEWNKQGYQGEFFIASGISGGYCLPVSRNINIEFSLGLGFLRTKYRHYHASHCDIHSKWHLVKQNSGNYSWFGPTKAKISFVWYPHFNIKKQGGLR